MSARRAVAPGDPASPRLGRSPRRLLRIALLCLGLLAATAPAWRVLLLGARPTLEEVRALVCGSRP